MPNWLVPFPGGVEKQAAWKGLVERGYSVPSSSAEVTRHYRRLFEGAGVAFQPNADGIGVSVRAAVPECDLLLKIRSVDGGSAVRVSCAAKSARAPATVESRPSGEARRVGDERTARVLAQAADAHRARLEGMSRFDEPVRLEHKSLHRDDAPPLRWPAWLVQYGTAERPSPERKMVHGKVVLESRYVTSLPMTKLHAFYEDLFRANGFRLGQTRIGTGQDVTGRIVQNKSGAVEAWLSENGKVHGPQTHITAAYNRSQVNGPITVRLQVRVAGSFGQRR